MKKRILSLFCILTLLVILAIPAFAVAFPSTNPTPAGVYSLTLSFGEGIKYVNLDSSADFWSVTFTGNSISMRAIAGSTILGSEDGNTLTCNSDDYPSATRIEVSKGFSSSGQSATVQVTVVYIFEPVVNPSFANPIQAGEYTVSDLIGTQTANRMYTTRDDPKTFTFTDVTANALTVVSYAIASEGGTVSYHNIGTLTEGFTFSSADYPVASFFTVRNTGSSLASYTVTVGNDSFDKTQSMAQNIWETCLSMGTSMINWLKTPSNFIALIPLAMFVLVGAVLMIRKLIKGV